LVHRLATRVLMPQMGLRHGIGIVHLAAITSASELISCLVLELNLPYAELSDTGLTPLHGAVWAGCAQKQ